MYRNEALTVEFYREACLRFNAAGLAHIPDQQLRPRRAPVAPQPVASWIGCPYMELWRTSIPCCPPPAEGEPHRGHSPRLAVDYRVLARTLAAERTASDERQAI